MEPVAFPDLDARVARLERGSRRDRAIGFAVLALLFVTAQAPGSTPVTTSAAYTVRDASGASSTLSATGLTVRDAKGNVRVFEGIDSGGRPSLDMHDTAGTLRESMYLLDGVPKLRLFDTNGKRREEVGLDDKGDGLFHSTTRTKSCACNSRGPRAAIRSSSCTEPTRNCARISRPTMCRRTW